MTVLILEKWGREQKSTVIPLFKINWRHLMLSVIETSWRESFHWKQSFTFCLLADGSPLTEREKGLHFSRPYMGIQGLLGMWENGVHNSENRVNSLWKRKHNPNSRKVWMLGTMVIKTDFDGLEMIQNLHSVKNSSEMTWNVESEEFMFMENTVWAHIHWCQQLFPKKLRQGQQTCAPLTKTPGGSSPN